MKTHRSFIRRLALATVAAVVCLALAPGRAAAQNVFVDAGGSRTVGEYNAATGAAVNPTFLTPAANGVYPDAGLAYLNNILYVASGLSGSNPQSVTAFNATTGAVAPGFTPIEIDPTQNSDFVPFGLLTSATGALYVGINNGG